MSMLAQRHDVLGQDESQTTLVVAGTYTPHGPMNISANADFAAHGWNGTGTHLNPYSISGLSFDAEDPIRIANTTAYFSITDCMFSRDANAGDNAITISNVTNGIIESCTFEQYTISISAEMCNSTRISSNTIRDCPLFGISLLGAFNTEVRANTIENATYGMELNFVIDSQITSNTVFGSTWDGIDIESIGNGTVVSDNEVYDISQQMQIGAALTVIGARDWTIVNNNIHDSATGISSMPFGTEQLNVSQNSIYNCKTAISLTSTENSTIQSNAIKDCTVGIFLTSTLDLAVIENTIEGGLFGLTIYTCTDCRIVDNHFQNCSISVVGNAPSDYINEVSGNTVNDGKLGYFVNEEDVTISSPGYEEIYLVNCTHVEIRNQVLSAVGGGVTMAFSQSCGIVNSRITGSREYGIYLYYTRDCYITDCTVTQSGSHFKVFSGICLLYSNSTEIARNLIYDNNGDGITLESSISSTIIANLITNNTVHGIDLLGQSSQNRMYGNEIGWNLAGNAWDDGLANSWDDGTSLGNWWSDYNVTPSNLYLIKGAANSSDHFPAEYKSWALKLPQTPLSISIDAIVLSIIGVVVILGGALLVLKRRRAI